MTCANSRIDEDTIKSFVEITIQQSVEPYISLQYFYKIEKLQMIRTYWLEGHCIDEVIWNGLPMYQKSVLLEDCDQTANIVLCLLFCIEV